MERQCVETTLTTVIVISESDQPVSDEEPFFGAFVNHTGPVHGLQVHDGFLYTCSGDKTARAYNLVVCSSLSCVLIILSVKLLISCFLHSTFQSSGISTDSVIPIKEITVKKVTKATTA